MENYRLAYERFLSQKLILNEPCGVSVSQGSLNPNLFDYQKATVQKSLQLGRCANFISTGLGKGFLQLAWLDEVAKETKKPVLLLAPLSVAKQFISEGEKAHEQVNYCESQKDIKSGINVANYEKLHKFSSKELGGIACDESSCIKHSGSKRFEALSEFMASIPFRLMATATPAPNDYEEFGTHAECLGIMRKVEMLSTFFTHDGGDTSQWILKPHGQDAFWKWLNSWAVVYRHPADIGFAYDYELPPLIDHHIQVDSEYEANEGELLSMVSSMADRRKAKKSSIQERAEAIADIIISHPERQFLIWCDLNDEQDYIAKLLGKSCVSISGSTKDKDREDWEYLWRSGGVQCLVSKPKIFGFGLNWQHCDDVIFAGINDSYEQLVQATARVWRFPKTSPVNRYLIFSQHEQVVFSNLARKAEQADRMWNESRKYIMQDLSATKRDLIEYKASQDMRLPNWLKFNVA